MFLDELSIALNKSIYRYPDVLEYLKSRGLDKNCIDKYRIGYNRIISVHNDGTTECNRFVDEMRGGKKFEETVVFPLQDAIGQVVGLIGRSISIKDFRIFATQRAKFDGFFFGFFQALPYVYSTNRVFVVEGPFDTVAMASIIPNTVGALTAGMSDNQYQLLKTYCDTIVTVFDSDKAGRRAAEKVGNRSGTWDLNLGYKDPSACLQKLSPDSFKKYVEKRIKEIPNF